MYTRVEEQGYKGISFPFRIGAKGGVVMSTTSPTDVQHIKESIKQVILTYMSERVMNPSFGSESLDILFEDYNETTKNMILFKLNEAVANWEERITVLGIDLTQIELEDDNRSGAFVVFVNFRVDKYMVTERVSVRLK